MQFLFDLESEGHVDSTLWVLLGKRCIRYPAHEGKCLDYYRRSIEMGSLGGYLGVADLYWRGAAGCEKRQDEAVMTLLNGLEKHYSFSRDRLSYGGEGAKTYTDASESKKHNECAADNASTTDMAITLPSDLDENDSSPLSYALLNNFSTTDYTSSDEVLDRCLSLVKIDRPHAGFATTSYHTDKDNNDTWEYCAILEAKEDKRDRLRKTFKIIEYISDALISKGNPIGIYYRGMLYASHREERPEGKPLHPHYSTYYSLYFYFMSDLLE